MNADYKEKTNIAYNLQLQNKLSEAAGIYEELLALSPEDVNVLNLYGLLNISTENYSKAIDLLSNAFVLNKNAYIATNLAKAYFYNNKTEQAIKFFNISNEIEESDDNYYSMAIAYKKLGEIDFCINSYLKSLELNPNKFNSLYNLALIYRDKKEYSTALNYALRAEKCFNNDENLITLIADLYEKSDNLGNAVKYYEKAFCINSENHIYCFNLGVLYSKLNDFNSCIKFYEKATEINPDYLEAYVNIAEQYRKIDLEKSLYYIQKAYAKNNKETNICLLYSQILKDLYLNNESIKILNDFLEQNPDNHEAIFQLAVNYMDLCQYHTAYKYYKRAYLLSSSNINYLHGLATALKYLGHTDKSKEILENIVIRHPDEIQSAISLGMIYLKEKNFSEGMRLYSKRSYTTKFYNLFKDKIIEKGKNITGKRILLYSDCGLGDTVMFSRYIPVLKNIVSKVILQTDKDLVSLLKTSFPNIEVIPKTQIPPDYDFAIPIMNLPYILNCDFSKIPYSSGYIKTSKNSQSFLFNTEKLKVGLFYCGNKKVFKNRFLMPSDVIDLTEQNNIQIYSFQLKDKILSDKIIDLSTLISDYSDTAALLKQLDVLVTVDSSVAHVAGAMGIKTFLLLPKIAEWRWFNDEHNTIWYDSVTIYKQTIAGVWSDVIKQVKCDLKKYGNK